MLVNNSRPFLSYHYIKVFINLWKILKNYLKIASKLYKVLSKVLSFYSHQYKYGTIKTAKYWSKKPEQDLGDKKHNFNLGKIKIE